LGHGNIVGVFVFVFIYHSQDRQHFLSKAKPYPLSSLQP